MMVQSVEGSQPKFKTGPHQTSYEVVVLLVGEMIFLFVGKMSLNVVRPKFYVTRLEFIHTVK
jgi:hypothetical protein